MGVAGMRATRALKPTKKVVPPERPFGSTVISKCF